MSDETPKPAPTEGYFDENQNWIPPAKPPYTPDSILWWLARVDQTVEEQVEAEPRPLLMKAAVMANLLQVQVMERQAEALERIAAALEAKTADYRPYVSDYSYQLLPPRMPKEPAYAPDEQQIYQCRNCRKLGRADFFGTPCESAPAGDPIGAHRLDRLVFASEDGDSFLVRKPL